MHCEIIDNLWISDIQDAREQSTEQFDLVVTVCQDSVEENVGCSYIHYPLADDEIAVKNWGGECSYDLFEAAALNVLTALRADQRVLVHCHAGQNRSAAVCAAALAVYEDSGYDEAFGKVGAARPIVNPNRTMKQFARLFIHEWL